MNLFTKSSTRQSFEDKLVELESIIGGNLFKKPVGVSSQRFWFHEGDWFYETHDSIGPMVARYQFTNGQAHKLVDGKPVAFAELEIHNLYKMIQLYHDQVYKELYAPQTDGSLVV